jgi:hypothetical protein
MHGTLREPPDRSLATVGKADPVASHPNFENQTHGKLPQ